MDLNSFLSPLNLPWGACVLSAPVNAEADAQFDRWLAQGRNASMDYMANHRDLRRDPRLLLEGAETLIAVAFPYFTTESIALNIALYARGRDYHEVIRERLGEVAARMPGQSRVCVDSAPLRERYWAVRAGLGAIGRNNQLFVPGFGSYCVLGFILSTERFEFETKPPSGDPCGDCMLCVKACPGACLNPDGRALDARNCESYLSIEHRGDHLPRRIHTIAGCDVCQRVCPLNRAVGETPIADFHPSPEFARLTAGELADLGSAGFRRLFGHSALRRAGLRQLKRNLSASVEC